MPHGRGVFKGDAERLQAELPPDSLLKRALIFEANPRIKRIVFVCTPHLGSPLAAGLLGRFGRTIIQLPARVLQRAGHLAAESLAAAVGQKGRFAPEQHLGHVSQIAAFTVSSPASYRDAIPFDYRKSQPG